MPIKIGNNRLAFLPSIRIFRVILPSMETIKVYLDDARPTPEGWVRVYTVEQCICLLKTRIVSHVSFDNDLGDGQPEGYLGLNTLEEIVYFDPTFPVPIITIHSSNAGRVPAMKQTAAKLELIRQQQTSGI